MSSRNDVTGDRIATKPSRAYEDNYDRIFRTPKPVPPGVPVQPPPKETPNHE